jgi:predicted RNase H-like HicB family nuclease
MENQKDSLSITENSDGTFLMEWDKEDQKWNWLNGKTSEEISAILTEAIQLALKENDL